MARQRGNSVLADVRIGKDRHRLSFSTMAEAEAWESQMRLAHEQGRPLPLHVGGLAPIGRRGLTIGELRKDTVENVWAGTKGEITAARNSQAAVDFFGPDCPVARIDGDEIDRWVRALKAAGNSGGTINRKLAALTKMLRRAVKRGHLASMPDVERQKESEGRIRWLTEEEEQRILATLRVWGKLDEAALVEFLIDTGARRGEAFALKWDDVNSANRMVTFWETKGGKPRSIPLTRRAWNALLDVRARHRDSAGPWRGLSGDSLRHTWDKLVQHLKLDDVVVHTLRHTCCSRLVQGGMDLRRVQVWMGHSTISTTMRYAHLAPQHLADLAALLEKPDNVVPLERKAG